MAIKKYVAPIEQVNAMLENKRKISILQYFPVVNRKNTRVCIVYREPIISDSMKTLFKIFTQDNFDTGMEETEKNLGVVFVDCELFSIDDQNYFLSRFMDKQTQTQEDFTIDEPQPTRDEKRHDDRYDDKYDDRRKRKGRG